MPKRSSTAAVADPQGQQHDLKVRAIPPEEQKKRERAVRRFRELDTEYRQSWLGTHQDIIDFIQPNRGRFVQTDTNRGTRKDAKVINNFATDKAHKLEAAVDVGVFSPAREWWVASLEDDADMENAANRQYCHDFQQAMMAWLSKVGFYAPNRNAVGDCIGPATGVVIIEEDAKKVARCTHIPVGQYRIAADAAGEPNVLCRVYTYTASQMAEEFGAENCSIAVRSALRLQRTQTAKFTVLHIIEPREDIEREYGKVDALNMPWSSSWMELGQGYVGSVTPGQSEQSIPAGPLGLLRESGYQEQPFYVYRWNQIGQDAYGIDSPGWNGLADTMQLQDQEFAVATLFALTTNPPKNRPDSLANASFLPGADNPIASDSHVKFEPSYVPPAGSMEAGRRECGVTEQRQDRIFFGDMLFLLSSNQTQGDQKTAEEVRGIKEERLLQLGGVFDRMAPAARIALRRLMGIFGRAGKLPKPPDALLQKDSRLRIDFVNPLVIAQKVQGYQGMQALIALEIQLGEAKKAQGSGRLNEDEIMSIGSDMLGVSPKAIYSDEVMAQRRQAQADAANAQQQAAAMPEAASAIKDLSNTDPDKLQANLQRFSPNAGAQGTAAGA